MSDQYQILSMVIAKYTQRLLLMVIKNDINAVSLDATF